MNKKPFISLKSLVLSVILLISLTACGNDASVKPSGFHSLKTVQIDGAVPGALMAPSLKSVSYSQNFSNGNYIISVCDARNLNVEIGSAAIEGGKFSLTMDITEDARYPVIIIKEKLTSKMLYRAAIGKIPRRSDVPEYVLKIKLTGITVDEKTTALAFLGLENGPPDIAAVTIGESDIKNLKDGVISKDFTGAKTSFDAAVEKLIGNSGNIDEIAKAVKTVVTVMTSSAVSDRIKNAIALSSVTSAVETIINFVRIIKGSSAISEISGVISANNLPTAIIYKGIYIDSQTQMVTVINVINSIVSNYQVNAPVFNPPAGAYDDPQKVFITCDTEDVTIRYTLDGSIPSENYGTAYTAPVLITSSARLNAVAIKPGFISSLIASALYTIGKAPIARVEPPVFAPAEGIYKETVSVAISCATPGATIKYTIDGSTPTDSFGNTYISPFLIASDVFIKAIAFKAGMTPSELVTAAYIIDILKPAKVSEPSFTPPGGTYQETVSVAISCATPGAIIKYTIDGSNPSESSGNTYISPVTIASDIIIKAVAFKAGMTPSEIAAEVYFIKRPAAKVAPPVITPAEGVYNTTIEVTIACATPGATIKYTLDGSIPSETGGLIYEQPIKLASTAILKAIAFKAGMAPSSIVTAAYAIDLPLIHVSPLSFKPAGGTYYPMGTVISVTIETATEGAAIKYTLDGTQPSASNGIVYEGPVTIYSSCTIKAVAIRPGMADSDIAEKSYYFIYYPPQPSNKTGNAIAVIGAPENGSSSNADISKIEGTASDPDGKNFLTEIKVRIKNGSNQYLNANNGTFSSAEAVNLAVTGTSEWSAALSGVDFADGAYTIEAAAFDGADGPFASSSFTINKKAPKIANAELATDNSYIDITFTAGVYKTGNTAITSGEFAILFSRNGGNATNAAIISVTDTSGSALTGGETTVRVNIAVTGTPGGVETVEIKPANANSIFDAAGNAMSAAQTTGNKTLYDKLPPEFLSSAIAPDNSYIDVTFTEGVYKSGGTALTAGELVLTFTQYGGNATNAAITSVTNASGGVLTGGETTIRVNIAITGTPDGLELVAIKPANGSSIFDGSANAMSGAMTTGNMALYDKLPPTIVNAVIASDNSYIDVAFSEGVYKSGGAGLTANEFAITFNKNGGSATKAVITSVTNVSGGALTGGETTVRVDIAITGTPNGVETVSIKPVNGTSIFDEAGNVMAAAQTTGNVTLKNQVFPVIGGAALASNNSYIDISFSSGVYRTGHAALTAAQFTIIFTQNGGSATGVSIASATKTTGAALTGGETTVRINLTVTGTPSGVETIQIKPANGASIYDGAGNAMPEDQTTGVKPLNEKILPLITGASVAANNSYIDVTFSEGVYRTGTAALTKSQFAITFTQNGGSATNAAISSVAKTTGAALTGGETAVRCYISITGTPSGVETVAIKPANGSSIFDGAGNAMAAAQTTGDKLLYDKATPTISSATAASDNSYIDITFSEGVYKTGSAPVTAGEFTLTFAKNGGNANGVTISSLTNILGGVLTGGETTIRANLDVAGTPSGVETVTIKPLNGSSIFDGAGNAMAATQTTGAKTLKDKLGPAAAITYSTAGPYKAGTTTVIRATFNETIADSPIMQISIGPPVNLAATNMTKSSSTLYTYSFTAGAGNGDASITFSTGTDAAGNLVTAVPSSGGTLTLDNAAPAISGAVLAANNSYVDVSFTEGVYNASKGALAKTQFAVTFAQNGGNATAVSIASVKKTNGSNLSGGETTVRVNLTITGTPVGVETISIKPANGASIYDLAGNAIPAEQSTATLTLADQIVLALSSWTLNMNTGHLVMTFNEPVIASTLNAAGIKVLAAKGSATNYALTDSATASANGTSIDITLSTSDINAIKATTGLAKARATSYLSVTAAAIKDLAGNSITAITDANALYAGAYTADSTAPALASWELDMDAGRIVMTFNEPVNAATLTATGIKVLAAKGSAVTRTLTGGTTASQNGVSISVALNATDINAIKATAGLAKNAENSYLSLTSAVIKDMASTGNSVSAITDANAMAVSAYTADATAPYVTGVSAVSSNAVNNMAIPGDIITYTITFNEVVTRTTITSATAFTNATGTVTEAADSALQTAKTITVTVVSGNNGAVSISGIDSTFADAAGNGITLTDPSVLNELVSQYVTVDTTPPSLIGVTAVSNNANTAWAKSANIVTYTLTFDEAVKRTAITSATTFTNATGAVTEAADTSLQINKTITVTVAAANNGQINVNSINSTFKDAVGNQVILNTASIINGLVAQKVTADNTAPVMNSWELNMNTGHILMNFNEQADASTLAATSITILAAKGSAVKYTLTGGTTTSADGTSIDIALTAANMDVIKSTAGLAKAAESSFMAITTAVIKDLAGNSVTAITTANALAAGAYTADSTAPHLLNTSALGANSGAVANNDTITLRFDEPMDSLTIGTSFDITLTNANPSMIYVYNNGATSTLATITTTSRQYNTGVDDMTFNSSTGTWSGNNKTLTIKLGGKSGGTSATGVPANTSDYDMSTATPAYVKDAAGNSITPEIITGTSSRF